MLARGIIQEPRSGYSSAIQFVDPANAKSLALHGAELRLGQLGGEPLVPVVVARNNGDVTTVISGSIPVTLSAGRTQVLPLSTMSISAGESKVLNLDSALRLLQQDAVVTAGLNLEYTGKPGSVTMSALSLSKSGNQVYQVPLLDPAAQKSSTGGYPWSIEDISSTVVYIKNTTNLPQQYVTYLYLPTNVYMIGVRTIDANQTAVIDVRRLRDKQVPDEEGRVIPKEATDGQIGWALVQTDTPALLSLIGRAEQIDEPKAISSSYACQNCCTDEVVDSFVSPNSVIMAAGLTQQMRAKVTIINCYGAYNTFNVNAAWASSDANVATVNSSGVVTGKNGGGVTITAAINYIETEPPIFQCGPPARPLTPNLPDPCGCSTIVRHFTPQAQVAVLVPSKLKRLDFPPRAPNGIGPMIVIMDETVLDTAGNPIPGKDHQCGAYRNLAYEVVDQNGDSFNYPYVITEQFSNYQGPDSLPADFAQSVSQNAVGDTMYFGKRAPACLGPNDHESFEQRVVVKYKNKDYPLSTVISVSRGRFAGTYKVDVVITTP